MPIERDNSAERQARIDRMINEFREAQARRVAKVNRQGAERKPTANPTVPVSGPATSQSR